MSERRQIEGTLELRLLTRGDEEMADNDIDRMVALTSPTLPQFNTYRPPAIEEGNSTDSTTPTHMTAYFPAATGSEDITTL